MSELIYRIVPRSEWDEALETGVVPRCASDERSGFVHLTTGARLLETTALYFEAHEQPVALEVSASAFGNELKWERVASRDNDLFPHLYAENLPAELVRAVIDLIPSESGEFVRGAREPVGTRH